MAFEELQNGRYRHLRLLGGGGMGEVYLMQDTRVSRQVAIKVLRAEDALYAEDEKATSSARLFEREARAIATLDHPNILPLYDFGEEEREGVSMTYMVMPYCTDGSLETWLRQRGGELLAPQDVAALIEQAAEALQYAHEHKVIHMDVKPPNFLIRGNRKDPQRPTLLLADFGIARNFTTVSSSSRTIRGTPAAMSPEQWSGEPVFASDQYSLAVMTYEMLVGRPPFTGTLEQLMYRHFTVPVPPPSNFNLRLPAALDEVLQRALSKKPEERFPSIADFASALTEAASQPAAYSEEELASYGTLTLSQSEAEAGISRMFTLDGGSEVTVSVPAGARNGQVLRLQGSASSADGQVGMVLVNIAIKQTETPPPPGALRVEQAPAPLPPVGQLQEARVEQASGASPLQQMSLSASSPLSTPEHDLPTIASLGNARNITVAPMPLARPRRRLGLLALVSLFVVLGLLGGSIYVFLDRQPVKSAAQSTSKLTVHLTLTRTATPAPTVTVITGSGEYIAGTYNGSMLDTTTRQTTVLSVVIVQTQNSRILKGSITFNSSPQQVYPLTGTVNTQGQFSFTVPQSSGQQPFYFYGTVQTGFYLRGDYCRASAGPCQTATGYFTVGPRY